MRIRFLILVAAVGLLYGLATRDRQVDDAPSSPAAAVTP